MPSGQDIMVQAGILLNDTAHVRWTLAELCLWINDAVKATILAKPSASSGTAVLSLSEGTLQTLDAPYLSLIDVTRNITSEGPPRVSGRVITMAKRSDLDAQNPGWHSNAEVRFAKEVRHVMFDELNPREFFVFPGNNGQGKIEAVVATQPTALAASGDPELEASYAGSIGLPEPYSVPIVDYVCYRAQSKDDIGGDAGRASVSFQAWAAAVGLKVQVEASHSPNARR